MHKDLLLEIGTEEIPAHAMPGILQELKVHAEKMLQDLRLEHGKVRTMGTPRRLALLVDAVAERQEDRTEEKKGPSLAVAFDKDGQPTRAAQGFARGQGVAVTDLLQRDGYVYALRQEKGEATAKLLQTALPALISGLSFPNSMRWGDLDFRFIRPLRWLVALFGEDVVPFTLANVQTGKYSRGHRFLYEGEVLIPDAAHYEKAMASAFVLVDPEKRKARIVAGLHDVANKANAKVEIDAGLLEEVLYLVEYPTALCGTFEEKYLQLPEEAVITPMRDHQRYFPARDAEGKLLPLFLTVRNGGDHALATVQHGNERVLRARLADAQFFFDEDRKQSLAAHVEKLKPVVFQEGLGTLYDKAKRLEALAPLVAKALGANEEEQQQAARAGLLAKADLVTGMVTEFTELQGVMGREYARLDGEPEAVAVAIDEHYRPRAAGGILPQTMVGLAVSLADKLDNILATFSRGLVPTGSEDPFALRRQALGMVLALFEAKNSIALPPLAEQALQLLGMDKQRQTELLASFENFLRLRLKNALEGQNIRYDVIDASLTDIHAPYLTLLKAQALQEAVDDGTIKGTAEGMARVANIVAKNKIEATAFDESLFETPEEKELAVAYASTKSAIESLLEGEDFKGALDALEGLRAPIAAFFTAVLVMVKDIKVQKNRLALLHAIDELGKRVVDLSKLVLA